MSELLELVKRSPALVKQHDKDGWLALFTDDGVIEDPVGAGAYVGRARHAKFWDAFIAPNDVTFHPHREIIDDPRVIRYVTISTVTPVSERPFELEAILEYVVRGERIASMRAFWQPHLAVGWHARQGLRGLVGLSKHGLRMSSTLGLGSAMGFSRAMVPSVSASEGRALAERMARAMGDRDEWLALTRGVRLAAGPHDDAERAWEALVGPAPEMHVEEAIVAGDHLACVLASDGPSAALIARVASGRMSELRLILPA